MLTLFKRESGLLRNLLLQDLLNDFHFLSQYGRESRIQIFNQLK